MIATTARIQDAASPAKWQFGVSSLLWLMATVGMCLAFARPFGMGAVTLVLFAPLSAAFFSLALARPGARQRAIYWAVVCSALGSLCVIPARLHPLTFVFWPVLGGVTGAYCGATLPQVDLRAGLVAGVIGCLFFTLFHMPFGLGENEFELDLAAAPIVCLGLAVLIRLIEWLRAQYGTPREIWAAALVFAVIVGHFGAVALTGGRFQ